MRQIKQTGAETLICAAVSSKLTWIGELCSTSVSCNKRVLLKSAQVPLGGAGTLRAGRYNRLGVKAGGKDTARMKGTRPT